MALGETPALPGWQPLDSLASRLLGAGALEIVENLPAWLFAAVRNRVFDLWRRRDARRRAGESGIVLFALFGFVVMWLWNWLMPKIFGLPQISYWEGWGLFMLAKIVFGGMKGSSRGEERRRKKKLRERMDEEAVPAEG
jgi:hypothetical protein